MRTGATAGGEERRAKTCCSASDAVDAQNVADRLDIPFYALDFERDFARIMDQFADEYAAGRTPNPCVMCNIWLKFGKLWSYGKQVGADFVATGHYARMARAADGSPRIARAVDRAKDQSYVLFGLRRELLPHVLFPVGEFPKAEIRAIAREPDSPCTTSPIARRSASCPATTTWTSCGRAGPGSRRRASIVDEDGTVLAEHAGIEAFTIGQRRGLGIAVGAPRYVVQIEPLSKTVTVGRRERSRAGGPGGGGDELAGAGSDGADPLPGADPRPAPRRRRHGRAAGRRRPATACGCGSTSPSRRSPRARSSPSTRMTWSSAEAGSSTDSIQPEPPCRDRKTNRRTHDGDRGNVL